MRKMCASTKTPSLIKIRYCPASISGPEVHELNITGTWGGDPPAFMAVKVFVHDTPINCALHTYELCFWRFETYQIMEGLDNPSIGDFSSPLIASFCPKYSFIYKINNEKCNYAHMHTYIGF